MARTKWKRALTFITNLKEILQNRMTDSLMFLKDIETKSDDKSTDVFKRYSKKKLQIMHER